MRVFTFLNTHCSWYYDFTIELACIWETLIREQSFYYGSIEFYLYIKCGKPFFFNSLLVQIRKRKLRYLGTTETNKKKSSANGMKLSSFWKNKLSDIIKGYTIRMLVMPMFTLCPSFLFLISPVTFVCLIACLSAHCAICLYVVSFGCVCSCVYQIN